MRLIKKDFVDKNVKSILGYPLPSGKAYYIENDVGLIEYGSDYYINNNNFSNEKKDIIDLTKGLPSSFKHNTTDNKQSNNFNKQSLLSSNERNYQKALLYLTFSEEKMKPFVGYKKYNNKFLSSIYSFYLKEDFLSLKQIETILKIEKNSHKDIINKYGYHSISLKNLETCYAYEYKIKRAIDKLEDKKFMQEILKTLYQYLYLTDKQIEAIRKWFQYLPKDLQEAKLRSFDV